MKIVRLLSSSFLVAGMAAVCPSGHALSIASMLHLHSRLSSVAAQKTEQKPQAELQIKNPNLNFRDLRIGDQVYTLLPNHTLRVTAPVGTPVYAASRMFHKHAKGELIAQVESGSHTLAVD